MTGKPKRGYSTASDRRDEIKEAILGSMTEHRFFLKKERAISALPFLHQNKQEQKPFLVLVKNM